jgi:hypothetical protein
MPAVDDRLPSSWRDLPGQLNRGQIVVLAERERAGANPGMLLCQARELAAQNFEGWWRRKTAPRDACPTGLH